MCDILFSLLDILVSILASFSEELAGSVEEGGASFINETFGCES